MKKIALLTTCFLLLAQLAFSQLGHWQWARAAGGGTGDQEGWSAATDKSGNVYETGEFSDTMTIDTVTLYNFNDGYLFELNIFLTKYSPAGNLLWARSAVIKDTGEVFGLCIATDGDNNVFVTGGYNGDSVFFGNTVLPPTGYGQGFFIVKYDSTGRVLWAQGAGGIVDDEGQSVTTDPAGNALVTGYYRSDSIQFGSHTFYDSLGLDGYTKLFIVKYSAAGQVLWARSTSPTNAPGDIGAAIATDRKGNVYAAGSFYSDSITFDNTTLILQGLGDVYLVKYDSTGNVLWAKSTGTADAWDFVNSITTDDNGNVAFTGFFQGDSIGFDNITLQNHSYRWDPFPIDYYVAKYDATGKPLWAKNSNGCYECEGLCIATDKCGNIFTYIGLLVNENENTFALGDTVVNVGAFWEPAFITAYNSSGQFISLVTLNSGGDDICGFCLDNEGNAYVGSDFVVDSFVLGPDTLFTLGNEEYAFVAKFNLNSCLLGCSESVNITIHGDTLSYFGASAYQWFFDGAILSNATQPVYIAKQPGTYSAQITDSIGCREMSGGVSVTGISEISIGAISIFPNPTTGSWELETDDNLIGAKASVFNIEGRLVYKTQIQNHLTEIVANAAPGIYFIKITGQQGEQTFKVAKE